MNISLHELLFEKAQHAIIKQNTATVANIILNDIRFIGYNLTSGSAFLSTHPNKIEFKGDYNNDGTTEDIRYYYGKEDEMSETPNPKDRILYRKEKDQTGIVCGYGVTELSVTYYDAAGSVTTTKENVRSIAIKLVMQGANEINGYYPTSIWETYFIPSNI